MEHFIIKKEEKPVKKGLSRKAKRNIWIAVIVILLAGAGIAGWIGYSATSALDKITGGAFSVKQIFQSTTLKNDNGRTNILLLGNGGSNHPGGQLTDTNIILSYDHDTKEAALISFPRDLYVKIADSKESNKLNYAYAYGEMNKDSTGGGGEAAKTTIENIAGVPIHYYIEVDFVGFKDLVDALGGVTVDVEKAINDPYYPKDYFDSNGDYHKTDAYSPFSISAGVQKLDGTTALKYARSRETTSDFDRAARQQKLIMAIRDKALSLGVLTNPKKVVDIINVLGNHMRTDLDISEMKELVSLSKELDMSGIKREVIDNAQSGLLVTDSSLGGYYLRPKDGTFAAIKKLVQNIFDDTSPDTSEVKGAQTSVTSEGRIEVYNGTGTPGEARLLAPKLRSAGLTVTALKTSSEIGSESILYDYTMGKDATAIAIIKELVPGVTVIRRTDGGDSLDFKLILGKNYTQ